MSRLEAKITLEYSDAKVARAIADAVSPDNYKAPAGLTVKTQQANNLVVTDVLLDGKLSTFIATIDDLLSCVSTAEKTLHVMKQP